MKKLTILILLGLLVGCAAKEPETIDLRFANITYADIHRADQNGTSLKDRIAMSEALRIREKNDRTDLEKTQDFFDGVLGGISGLGAVGGMP